MQANAHEHPRVLFLISFCKDSTQEVKPQELFTDIQTSRFELLLVCRNQHLTRWAWGSKTGQEANLGRRRREGGCDTGFPFRVSPSLLPFLLLPMGERKTPFQILQASPSIPIQALAQRGQREDWPHGAELNTERAPLCAAT